MSDWGFKKLFGTEANKNLLKYLLNNVIEDKNIVDLRHLDRLYFIGFTTFNLFKDSDKCVTKAQMMDVEVSGRALYDKYLQIYIEMDKFVSNTTS